MTDRVIALLDLDCFYCQVEHVRLGIPLTTPLAVQQWAGLIAVNYAARAKGVTRFMNAREARAKCPDITLVHVELIGGANNLEGCEVDTGKGLVGFQMDRNLMKVSLERYRIESSKIFKILQRFVAEEFLEKASVDEAFLDISSLVDQDVSEADFRDVCGKIVSPQDGEKLTQEYSFRTESDARLFKGASIINQIRKTIFDELGYTCSAGIAHNKMLAKLVCSFNKPNGQTVCPYGSVTSLLSKVSLTSLRGFGGKVGKSLLDLMKRKLGKASDDEIEVTPNMVIQNLSLEDLIRQFDHNTSNWILSYCKGMDDSQILGRSVIKSLVAAKAFRDIPSYEDIQRWIKLLSNELVERIEHDREINNRVPVSLTLQLPLGSRSTQLNHKNDVISSQELQAAALALFETFGGSSIISSCTRMQLSVAKFKPVFDKSDELGQITNYFKIGTLENQPNIEDDKTATTVQDENPSLSKTCDICKLCVLEKEFQEHLDFHLAQDLQQIEEDKRSLISRKQNSVQKNTSTSKKRKPTSSSQPSIKSFFSK
jgi:DNA polymerase eta